MILLRIYLVVSPLIWGVFRLFSLITSKGRERFFSEYGCFVSSWRTVSKLRRDGRTPVVIHAASGGEYEQVAPLLARIDRSQYIIIQTVFSPTIFRKIHASDMSDVTFYHPPDSLCSAVLFFLLFRPGLYITNRHDVWPAHLWVARLFNCTTAYVNANIYPESVRYARIARPFYAAVFRLFDTVFTGSDRLRHLLHEVQPRMAVSVVGDTRFERVRARAEQNSRRHFNDEPQGTVLVLGSLISSDYVPVFTGVSQYRRNGGEVAHIIVVPHEVDAAALREAEKALSHHGFTSHRYSESPCFGRSDAVIIDSVGILAELYAYGDWAYVGAGFGAGVHSVIEPAVYALPVAYGPRYTLLDEAVTLAEENLTWVVHCATDFAHFLAEGREQHELLSQKLSLFISASCGASTEISVELGLNLP
ncbi:3-deoxy-D-manno-octulosonic acid transferase [Chitinivibrio alkaliphilus]|uniref:3-deoxy-D-manno-octulosonic acid transferase n=1 Tax=Chitinivibrio alkaliphilus ACht1 TaxID=1313304 RepID=U7D9U7_9BACT|nr:glycosyltransferase N-terminal domain-containing protein [Chitinivibrio alkaliphilus]ERP39179.1 3-deoxy-D-manno-octulosonic-acid transferase [Chitinivibrio alkaliphilus ACht1]